MFTTYSLNSADSNFIDARDIANIVGADIDTIETFNWTITADVDIIRIDGETFSFTLETSPTGEDDQDEVIDGFSYTIYDNDNSEYDTGGDQITTVDDLEKIATLITTWANELDH